MLFSRGQCGLRTYMFTPVILALRRLRQEDGHEFRNSLNYTVRLSLPQKGGEKKDKEGGEEEGRG